MDELEIIKENVQPLRNGRQIEILKTSLAMDKSEREAIRKKYENDIQQTTDEDECFKIYYEYINWIEQSYPNGVKEENFYKVLESCIQKYFQKENYQNNEKMLSIFLKYTNIVNNCLNAFEFFYKANFAKKLSGFYTDWSYHLEMQKNYKKAMKVLKAGIKHQAQPISELNRALEDLEVRTMRFVLENPEEANERQQQSSSRKALNTLPAHVDSHGIINAPIKRAALTNSGDGLRKLKQNQNLDKNNENENNVPLKIYDEEEQNNENEEEKNEKDDKFQSVRAWKKENEMKPDKWTGNQLPLKTQHSSSKAKFDIFTDSNNDAQNMKKDEPKIPVAVFEEKAKLKRYIWYGIIKEMYRDGTEYSFEEIRYQKWLKKRQEKQIQNKTVATQEAMEIDETVSQPKTDLNTTVVASPVQNQTKELTATADSKLYHDSVLFKACFADTIYNSMNQSRYVKLLKDGDVTNTSNIEDFQIISETIAHQELFNTEQDLANNTNSRQPYKQFLNSTIKSKLTGRLYSNGNTSKLSTIEENSREDSKYSSSSSSSSSGTMSTGEQQTIRKLFSKHKPDLNPFDSEVKRNILSLIFDPIEFRKNFEKYTTDLPKLDSTQFYEFGESLYNIYKEYKENEADDNKAKWFVYGKVPPDFNFDRDDFDFGIRSLKISPKLDYWEFYISDEVERRLIQNYKLGTDIELSVMTLDRIIFYQNGYLAFYDVNLFDSLDSLLSKRPFGFNPAIVALVALELILIIQKLHDCEIIHSNISMDNVALFSIAKDDIELIQKRTCFTKLLDFSLAIDMAVLPENFAFETSALKTTGSTLLPLYNEILKDKHWNYQIDWIGFVDCIYQITFGEQLKVFQNKSTKKWTVVIPENSSFEQLKLPFLSELFNILLNLEPNQKPNLDDYVNKLAEFVQQDKFLQFEIAKLFVNNILINQDFN